MARPKSITNEQILGAAQDAFLESGLAATTADIARRAGISEGTIFKRFGSKDDLFLAAMGLEQEPPWVATLDELVGNGDLRCNLERIAREALAHFEKLIPKKIMLLSCRITPRQVFEGQKHPRPVQFIGAMARFFTQEQALGRVADCDPQVLARTLLGALHHFAFAETSGLNAHMTTTADQYIAGLLDIVMTGVAGEVTDEG